MNEDTGAYWDAVYAGSEPIISEYDGWLDGIAFVEDEEVLDLGCGNGRNTGYLLRSGAHVSACDVSSEAVAGVRLSFPEVDVKQVDIRQSLPYPDESFATVVASLCLHYFDWATTEAIVEEIDRIIMSGGRMVFQVNSDLDGSFGAGDGTEVEDGYFCKEGHYKRFFTEAQIDRLFATWIIDTVDRRTILRNGTEKHVFFGTVMKRR